MLVQLWRFAAFYNSKLNIFEFQGVVSDQIGSLKTLPWALGSFIMFWDFRETIFNPETNWQIDLKKMGSCSTDGNCLSCLPFSETIALLKFVSAFSVSEWLSSSFSDYNKDQKWFSKRRLNMDPDNTSQCLILIPHQSTIISSFL